MNNSITKVNIQQIEELISKLKSVSNSVNANIKEYQKNLNMIESAGYLAGVAEMSINLSCDKISKTCLEFQDYATRLASSLSEVTKQTQQIETTEKNNINSIISQDATKFAGIIGATVLGTGVSTGTTSLKEILDPKTKYFGSIFGATNSSSTGSLQQHVDNLTNGKPTAPSTGTTTEKTVTNDKTSSTAEKPVTNNSTAATTTPVVKTGKKMSVPSGNTSLKTYTNISKVGIAKNTTQAAVLYGKDGFTMENGSYRQTGEMPYGKFKGQSYNTQTDKSTGVRYVTFEGDDEKYYCAALGTYYGEVGDTFKVTTDTGNTFNVIMADAKGSDSNTSYNGNGTWYHNHGNAKSVVEFYCEFIPDDMKVPGGNTGTFNSVPQFSGNIKSIEKLS